MKLALEIINKEIAQRELANKHDHLRKEICTKEIEELKQVVNLLSIQNVSESSWAYYEKELDKIEQLNQTQSSLHKQMFILRHFANKLGLYDVADYLKR